MTTVMKRRLSDIICDNIGDTVTSLQANVMKQSSAHNPTIRCNNAGDLNKLDFDVIGRSLTQPGNLLRFYSWVNVVAKSVSNAQLKCEQIYQQGMGQT